MKTNLLSRLIVIAFTIASSFYSQKTEGQSLQIIPNPDAGNVVPFSRMVVYNNNVYVLYSPPNGSTQLAQYDGFSLTLIPNPDAGNVADDLSGMTVFNNKLYFEYKDASNMNRFAQYDGSSITLISYPPGTGSVRIDSSIIYNNKLYFKNLGASGIYQLLQFDGANITLLPNPDKGSGYSNISNRVVYNNKLYFNYLNNNNVYQLVQFDGTSWTFIPNPDGGNVDASSQSAIYNNDLYFEYRNAQGVPQLAQFDGTSVTLIPNPNSNTVASFSLPVVYNNKLYMTYYTPDSNYTHLIAEFNGSSITLIPKPALTNFYANGSYSGYGCYGNFVTFNNKLYISYYTNSNGYFGLELAQFDSTAFTITPAISSTSVIGGWGIIPLVASGNELIISDIRRVGIYNRRELGLYDGSSFTFIAPPPIEGDLFFGPLNNFNNQFYFIYSYSNGRGSYTNQLGYLGTRTLPVTLLNFKGQLQDNNAFLQWQTATEQNGNHFTIRRSKDGISFSDIGEVKAVGNSNSIQKYNYTDRSVVKLGASKLFYRLQEVDNDGKKQVSNVVSIDITNRNDQIKIYPNPANNTIFLDWPQQLSPNSLIVLYDVNGRKIIQQKPQLNNLHQQLNLNKLQSGNYSLEIIDGGKKIFTKQVVIVH